MTMERWRPRGMRRWRPLSEELDRLFEELAAPWRRLPSVEAGFVPSMDVYEEDGTFVIRADLPGVSKEDIDVSVTGDTLTIRGSRKAKEEVKEENYYCSESFYGNFSRSITLPATVEADKAEAIYENGVLELHVPKAREAMPSKIEIKPK